MSTRGLQCLKALIMFSTFQNALPRRTDLPHDQIVNNKANGAYEFPNLIMEWDFINAVSYWLYRYIRDSGELKPFIDNIKYDGGDGHINKHWIDCILK